MQYRSESRLDGRRGCMDRISEAGEVAKLAMLRDAGLLTDKEFRQRKRQLLASGERHQPNPWVLVIAIVVLVAAGGAAVGTAVSSDHPKTTKIELTASTTDENAAAWAEHMAATPATNHEYHTLCLEFVTRAWRTGAHHTIRAQMDTPLNTTTYPATVWPRLSGGLKGTTDTPPVGAIGFWNSTHGKTYSHSAVSVGGGTFISTNTAQSTTPDYTHIHRQSFAEFAGNSWAIWDGWWLPDGSNAPPSSPPATSTGPVVQASPPATIGSKVQSAGGGSTLQPATGGSSLQGGSGDSTVQPASGSSTLSSPPTSPTTAPATSASSRSTTTSAQPTTTTSTTPSSTNGSSTPPTTTPQSTASPVPTTYAETVGGVSHTWTNYTNAGGTEGPEIGAYQTVQISCRLQGFKVADGNTWWYRIAQSPWSTRFYVSADAFYNNGQTSGSLIGTPFVTTNVPLC